jgi:hypothetical protein
MVMINEWRRKMMNGDENVNDEMEKMVMMKWRQRW